ncbi:MAG: molybdopterin-dependent oxidoreductase [Thermoleophilia bacterium]
MLVPMNSDPPAIVTTCTLDCPDRCSLLCRSEDGRLRLRGNPDHPYTRGFTCAKIHRYPGRLRSPSRLTQPHMRRGGRTADFVPVSWDEALDAVCAALESALAHDPASVLLLRGYGSMGASMDFTDAFFASLGARTTRDSLCDGAGGAACRADTGALDMNDPREIDRAEAVVLWGKNPWASSIHTAAQVRAARQRGAPVLAVTPDGAAVASLADHVVCVRPGADRFLALAVTGLLLRISDRRPPWERAANPETFAALLAAHSLDELLAACDTPREDAEVLARTYARTERVATIVGWGVQRHRHGGENVRAIHALAFLAGTLGVPGGGFYYNMPSSRHRRPVSWPGTPRTRPRPLLMPRLALELPAADPPVRFAWAAGSNIANQGPQAPDIAQALRRVDTVVAVEAFWTETARAAGIVLPPALWLETEDVVTSYWQNQIGAARKVVEPPPGCRPDFEITREVARRLGRAVLHDTLDDWLRATLPENAPSLEELRARGWALLPWPRVAWADGFAHPDGRFRLLETLSPAEPAEATYPLRLLTGVRREALHSQILPEEHTGRLPVRLHPETARSLGLTDGQAVRVISPQGRLEAELHVDPRLHPKLAACPRGGWLEFGQGVNAATQALVTDLGECAAYYATPVRVEPAGGNPGHRRHPPAGGESRVSSSPSAGT